MNFTTSTIFRSGRWPIMTSTNNSEMHKTKWVKWNNFTCWKTNGNRQGAYFHIFTLCTNRDNRCNYSIVFPVIFFSFYFDSIVSLIWRTFSLSQSLIIHAFQWTFSEQLMDLWTFHFVKHAQIREQNEKKWVRLHVSCPGQL